MILLSVLNLHTVYMVQYESTIGLNRHDSNVCQSRSGGVITELAYLCLELSSNVCLVHFNYYHTV